MRVTDLLALMLERRAAARSRRYAPAEQVVPPAVTAATEALRAAVQAGDPDAGERAEAALVSALAGERPVDFHAGVRRPVRQARTASQAMAEYLTDRRQGRWR